MTVKLAAKHVTQKTQRSVAAVLKVTFFSGTSVADIVLRAPMRTEAGVSVSPAQHHVKTAGITRTALPASLVTSSTRDNALNSVLSKPSATPAGGAVSLATARARHATDLAQQTATFVLVGIFLYMDSVLTLTAHRDSILMGNMVNVTRAMFPVRPVLAHRHWIVLRVLKDISWIRTVPV